MDRRQGDQRARCRARLAIPLAHLLDAFELTDSHIGWTDDEGLFRPDPLIATFSNGSRIALPVLVLGRDRDRTVAATMTLAELGRMVTLDRDPSGR